MDSWPLCDFNNRSVALFSCDQTVSTWAESLAINRW